MISDLKSHSRTNETHRQWERETFVQTKESLIGDDIFAVAEPRFVEIVSVDLHSCSDDTSSVISDDKLVLTCDIVV